MGPACPQPIAHQPKYFDPTNQTSEDCLTLNIYTPISGKPLNTIWILNFEL